MSKINEIKYLLLFLFVSLTACNDGEQEKQAIMNASGQLQIPERASDSYITDQTAIAGRVLYLWKEKDRCALEVLIQGKSQGGKQILMPTAPCRFIDSPGTEQVQVFQRDKTTRVIALIGNPSTDEASEPFCGRMVQGLIITSRGQVRLSNNILSDENYCDDQGLDNDQYAFFSG